MGSRFLGQQLFNPAGGLAYHWRAMRHRRGLWQPFQASIASWLSDWRPRERQLALIGPSAGHNFPFAHLRRYERVTTFEPDPVACWLFAKRARQTLGAAAPALHFVHSDHLVHHCERLSAFLGEQEPTAVLFCNVLGQLVHLLPVDNRDVHLSGLKQQVKQLLVGRSWASFHDRVSGPLAPTIVAFAAPRRLSDEEVIQRTFAVESQTPAIELVDHETEGFFPDHLPHSYFAWQLGPRAFHLIEAVRGASLPQ